MPSPKGWEEWNLFPSPFSCLSLPFRSSAGGMEAWVLSSFVEPHARLMSLQTSAKIYPETTSFSTCKQSTSHRFQNASDWWLTPPQHWGQRRVTSPLTVQDPDLLEILHTWRVPCASSILGFCTPTWLQFHLWRSLIFLFIRCRIFTVSPLPAEVPALEGF